MACYHPLEAFYSKDLNRSGKRSIVFNPRQALQPDVILNLPCGQCIGCRLERSRQWAIRCMHESKMHRDNCFITLTYDEKNLPTDGSLHKEDYQNFLKRLRKELHPQKVRYYMCGEYGDQTSRPHFHACLFGYRPEDLTLYKTSNGNRLYNSKLLQKIWSHGHVVIGELTFESAAYVARYVMKKITGKNAHEHYDTINEKTGEVTTRIPEYNQPSLKPAIGRTYLEKYKGYILDHDGVIVNGKKVKPPKYYDKLLSKDSPIQHENNLERRVTTGKKNASDNTPERLAVKEIVHAAQLTQKRKSQ